MEAYCRRGVCLDLSDFPHHKVDRAIEHVQRKYNSYLFAGNKATEVPAASPQLLSKLFPQTAVGDHGELQAEQEKKKQEEEGLI